MSVSPSTDKPSTIVSTLTHSNVQIASKSIAMEGDNDAQEQEIKSKEIQEDAKLVYGIVFSLKNIINKLISPFKGYLSLSTNVYKLHFLETPSCTRFVLLTDPSMENLQDVLHDLYSKVYVETVVKNPLESSDPTKIENHLFQASLDSFIKGLFKSPETVGRFYSQMIKYRSYSSLLSAASINVSRSKTLKELTPLPKLVFGQTFTDHMLTIDWNSTKGWDVPKIRPYAKLAIDPSAVCLHYGLECFEGMKAYKDSKGQTRLFRPEMNMNRFLKSSKRLALPSFDKKELLTCIKEFLKVEERWIPDQRGYSLYIRPTMIGTQESLGVGPTNRATIFVIAQVYCPVGPYYKTGFAAVSLYATTAHVRAWPGGTGDCKVGGNYAPGIMPQIQVAKEGYQQNLWLFGNEDYITEVGTMNLFLYWINSEGERELVTPPLDGTILPGVTRDSVLSLSRSWKEFKVSERPVKMSEITAALDQGRLLEMFGSGTAAIVSPIKNIRYQDKDWAIPLDPKNPSSQAGPLTKKIADTIMGIQYGEIPHNWSVIVD